MHQCLYLSEILEVIFYFVFNDKIRHICPHLDIEDRHSIYRLALTCRTFRDVALNVLYSNPGDSWPLIFSSRPSQLRLRTPELSFRPLIFASRIKNLTQPSDAAYPSFLACAQKQSPLFPNLQSLTWQDCSLTSIPVLNLLLPTLEILNLDLSASESFHKAIIPALPTSAPRLKALILNGSSLFVTHKNSSQIVSLLISYPHGLRELSLTCVWHDVPSTVLNVIAPWPSLRSLTLKLGLRSIPTAPLYAPRPFAALTHLHISSNHTLDLFISFLRTFKILNFDSSNIASSNLKTIQFNAESCSPANTWSQFLASLTHTNAKLEHIILTEKCQNECPPPSSFDFRPLLMHQSLTYLNTLILSPGRTSSITLTDADILTLARTCPDLHILDLALRNTPVSLHALNILVRRCRELRQVLLYVDARVGVPRNAENEDELGLQPNTRLIQLAVGDSPITYTDPLHLSPELTGSIPHFLHAMAPRLKSVTDIPFYGGHKNPWRLVERALKRMVENEDG